METSVGTCNTFNKKPLSIKNVIYKEFMFQEHVIIEQSKKFHSNQPLELKFLNPSASNLNTPQEKLGYIPRPRAACHVPNSRPPAPDTGLTLVSQNA